MYAEVVIPSYKGQNADSFTYEVPASLKIKPGQLAVVPFGKREVTGIIFGICDKSPEVRYQIKTLKSIIFDIPFLHPYQLKLLDWMAHYYLSTKGNCLNAMLPEIPSGKSLIISGKWKSQVSRQTLILVPSINRLPEIMARFPESKFPAVYHNQLKTSGKIQIWQKILSGNCDYIFGSRSAVFSPCPKPKEIIIFDEHDSAYKDERSPYFDTLTIADKLRDLTGIRIQIIDTSPKIATVFAHKKAVRIPISRPAVKTYIASMVDEKLAGNNTPVSEILATRLKSAFKKGERSLLFLNRKNESGNLYCRSCKQQQRMEKEPDFCPNCRSVEFWFNSLNVNTLAATVKNIIPKANIAIISNSAASDPKSPVSDIDIATAAVFYRLQPKRYALVADISGDSPLQVPDYNAEEKTYNQIISLKKLCSQVFILQTANPQNDVLTAAASGDYVSFAKGQLNQLKALSYPPYGLLIKIVVKGKTSKKAEVLESKLHAALQNTINLQKPLILGPFEPFFKKKNPVFHIVLKIPLKAFSLAEREKALKHIAPLLHGTGAFKAADQIIVDPNTLN